MSIHFRQLSKSVFLLLFEVKRSRRQNRNTFVVPSDSTMDDAYWVSPGKPARNSSGQRFQRKVRDRSRSRNRTGGVAKQKGGSKRRKRIVHQSIVSEAPESHAASSKSTPQVVPVVAQVPVVSHAGSNVVLVHIPVPTSGTVQLTINISVGVPPNQ